jgi:hypothetical protein
VGLGARVRGALHCGSSARATPAPRKRDSWAGRAARRPVVIGIACLKTALLAVLAPPQLRGRSARRPLHATGSATAQPTHIDHREPLKKAALPGSSTRSSARPVAGARAACPQPALRSASPASLVPAAGSHARLAWAPRSAQFAAARLACKARASHRLGRSLTEGASRGPRLRRGFRLNPTTATLRPTILRRPSTRYSTDTWMSPVVKAGRLA